jgi:hypothetical protein
MFNEEAHRGKESSGEELEKAEKGISATGIGADAAEHLSDLEDTKLYMKGFGAFEKSFSGVMTVYKATEYFSTGHPYMASYEIAKYGASFVPYVGLAISTTELIIYAAPSFNTTADQYRKVTGDSFLQNSKY